MSCNGAPPATPSMTVEKTGEFTCSWAVSGSGAVSLNCTFWCTSPVTAVCLKILASAPDRWSGFR
eukprot:2733755-Prymnesium_polylepis.1